MPKAVYGEVVKRKGKSMTAYVLEAVEEKLAREREAELRMGFRSLVPLDDEENAGLAALQRKAMKHVDD